MNFKDVTAKNRGVISAMRESGIHESIRVFERNNTEIIYSYSEFAEHASLYNPNRKVRKSEIDYCIKKIFKHRTPNMITYVTPTGIVHIHQNLTVSAQPLS